MKENLKVVAGKRTVKKLLSVGKKLFTERGYANTPMEEVVRMA